MILIKLQEITRDFAWTLWKWNWKIEACVILQPISWYYKLQPIPSPNNATFRCSLNSCVPLFENYAWHSLSKKKPKIKTTQIEYQVFAPKAGSRVSLKELFRFTYKHSHIQIMANDGIKEEKTLHTFVYVHSSIPRHHVIGRPRSMFRQWAGYDLVVQNRWLD